MITPLDAAEWLLYVSQALVARLRADTLGKARTAHILTPPR